MPIKNINNSRIITALTLQWAWPKSVAISILLPLLPEATNALVMSLMYNGDNTLLGDDQQGGSARSAQRPLRGTTTEFTHASAVVPYCRREAIATSSARSDCGQRASALLRRRRTRLDRIFVALAIPRRPAAPVQPNRRDRRSPHLGGWWINRYPKLAMRR
jgi:hypothetical protein